MLESFIIAVIRGFAGNRAYPLAALLAFLLGSGAGTPLAAAQDDSQAEVPTIEPEPRYTRIYGSDTVYVWHAALSPDGRWVAFSITEDGEAANLWIVPAQGGEPRRLTSRRHLDTWPLWFPAGDRIAFVSNRPERLGRSGMYLMTLPLDPRTGRGTGPVRQVSLEQIGRDPALSPDGRWFAYRTAWDSRQLKVLPATGGHARTLAELDGAIFTPAWSADGRYVYFVWRPGRSDRHWVMRVPAGGGSPDTVSKVSWLLRPNAIGPGARFLIRRLAAGSAEGLHGPRDYEIATIEGHPIARLTLQRNMKPVRFTPDGRGLVAVVQHLMAPIRVVPVAGGPGRQLNEARAYDWPLGWTRDGQHLFFWTRVDGVGVVLDAPVDGGAATLIPLADSAVDVVPSAGGRYIAYSLPTPGSDDKVLVVQRVADGHTRVVSRTQFRTERAGPWVSGPGGMPLVGEEFLYFERRGDRVELRASPPEGPSRLLRSFPLRFVLNKGFGVFGDRLAYGERAGDSSTVYVVRGRNGVPKPVATVLGEAAGVVWSPDGRWIATEVWRTGERFKILVVGVGPEGEVVYEPGLLDAGGAGGGWGLQWLPDSRAVTIFAEGTGLEADVWLVPIQEGVRPVNLTRDDPAQKWGYLLSPDGRYVAYPSEVRRGSSIWLVDLGDALAQGSRRRP